LRVTIFASFVRLATICPLIEFWGPIEKFALGHVFVFNLLPGWAKNGKKKKTKWFKQE